MTNETDNAARYAHLMSEIVANKTIWLLKAHDGLFAMFEDSNNQSYIPVWPSEKEAAVFSVGDWDNYVTEGMEFYEFLNWMEELKEDAIFIGAYPGDNMQSMAIDPIEFKRHLIKAAKS